MVLGVDGFTEVGLSAHNWSELLNKATKLARCSLLIGCITKFMLDNIVKYVAVSFIMTAANWILFNSSVY